MISIIHKNSMEDYKRLKYSEYMDLLYYARHGKELINMLNKIGSDRYYSRGDNETKVGFAYTVLHRLDYDLDDLERRVPSRYLKKKR